MKSVFIEYYLSRTGVSSQYGISFSAGINAQLEVMSYQD